MEVYSATQPPFAAPSSRKGNTKWVLIALLVLTATAYANSLANGFTWDDEYVLVRNESVHTLENPGRFVTDPSSSTMNPGLVSYRPLRTLVYALVYRGFGLNPFPYHLLNLLLHLANVTQVFILLSVLGVPRGCSLSVAGLFGLHPIQTEAVSSVTGLTDVLFAFFYLLALLLFARAPSSRRRLAIAALAWLSLVAALASKEMALTLPLTSLLVSWRLGTLSTSRPEGRFHLALSALFALTSVAWWAARWTLMGQFGYVSDLPGGTLYKTVLMEAEAVSIYLRLLFVPLGLSVRHVIDVPESVWQARTLAALLVVVALVALSVRAWRFRSEEALGLAWFWVTLLPVLNFVPLRGDLMGERFLYLPMVGFMLALAAVAGQWLGRLPRAAGWAAASLAIVTCAGLTAVRNRDWKDNQTLFESAVRVAPTSNAVRLNLAREYRRLGRETEAMEQLRAAHENTQRYYERYLELGDRARARRDPEEARIWYGRALRMRPQDPVASARLAQIAENSAP